MKSNQDKMSDIIKALSKTGLLDNLILIGSWAMFFYRDVFPNFTPAIRTTDLDFYVPEAKLVVEEKSTIKALHDIRYEVMNDTLTNRTSFISPDGFELEFLTGLNRQRLDCVKIGNTDIYAESLPYLDIFNSNYLKINYQGINIKIASPASFVLQKLLINDKRERNKKHKDLIALDMVLFHIKNNKVHKKELVTLFGRLSKKQQNHILKIAANNSIDLGIN